MSDEIKWPKRVIVSATDLIRVFGESTMYAVWPGDLDELVTQVIDVLLNANTADLSALNNLPDFNRMSKQTEYLANPLVAQQIRDATRILGLGLNQRFRELGLYDRHRFSYYLESFLNRDLILSYLPY